MSEQAKPAPVVESPVQAGGDILQRLKNLKFLHDQCLISDEEYKRKEREIISPL